jgi:hypothetical protein
MSIEPIERVVSHWLCDIDEDVNHSWDISRNPAVVRVEGGTKGTFDDPAGAFEAARDVNTELLRLGYQMVETASAIGAAMIDDGKWRGTIAVSLRLL